MNENSGAATAEVEDRVEEFAVTQFERLGFKGRLPDELVQTYNDFKRIKDRLNPGRLSAEGFALVVSLYTLLK